MSMPTQALLLLSGGLDSATCLAIARARGFEVHALTIAYGQRHEVELRCAAEVARALGAASHTTVALDLRAIGGSSLTSDLPVPMGEGTENAAFQGGAIPSTYVPARNTIFLSLALGQAEVLGISDLFIGVNAVDYSGYPDCRPEFVSAFEALARVATRAGVEGRPFTIHAPLMQLSKAEIIRAGAALGVDYSLTHSCYSPLQINPGPSDAWAACGRCDSCRLRREGFAAAGVPDPTRYA